MPTSYISKITLPTGNQYDIKDAYAWTQIESLQSQISAITGGNAVVFVGVSTTELTDGGNQTPTVGGSAKTPAVGQLFFYGAQEFIYGTDNKWHALGDLSTLGNLATKNTVSVTYNKAIVDTTNTKFTGSSMTSTGKFTPAGTVTVTTNATTNKTATVAPASSGTATYTPAGTVSQPTFTGTALTSTGKFTPAGNVALNTTNKTAAVSTSSTGEATYTPEGSVAAPTISVATAGSTTTIKNPTSSTVAKTVVAAAPGTTAPANNIAYYSVTDENLSLYQLGYTTGDSITTSNVTVKTGDAAYSASAPAFTGTGVRLVTDNIAVPNTATFTGTEGNVSVSGTPEGTVSQPTFGGTGVRLVTGNIAVPSTYTATFAGTKDDVSVSGTTKGSISVSLTQTTTPASVVYS